MIVKVTTKGSAPLVSALRAKAPLTEFTMNQPTLAVSEFNPAGRMLPQKPKPPRLWTIWGTPNLGPQEERMPWVSEPMAVPTMMPRATLRKLPPKTAMPSTPT